MDPVTFSIIRHRLFRVVEEAVITLKHVSGSAITNEGHDLMVSLYQADGSLLMGGVGFLHHLTSAAEACKAIIRKFEGRIGEDDLFLLNDPYTAALHTSDIYLVSPIHYGGKLAAGGLLRQQWPCPSCRRHWTMATNHGRLVPAFKLGDLFEGCQAGTLPVLTAGSQTPSVSRSGYTFLPNRMHARRQSQFPELRNLNWEKICFRGAAKSDE